MWVKIRLDKSVSRVLFQSTKNHPMDTLGAVNTFLKCLIKKKYWSTIGLNIVLISHVKQSDSHTHTHTYIHPLLDSFLI